MEAERRRRMRGWILQFLAQSRMDRATGKREPMGLEMLGTLFKTTGLKVTEDDLDREVGYLAEKGLIVIDEWKGAAARVMKGGAAVRIVASGLDLIDGTTTDPGIDFGAFANQ